MAYTTINKSTDYFNTVTYSGTGSSNAVTGVGFQPDWVWIKERNASSSSHNLTDSVRGAGKGLFSDGTSAEYDYGTGTSGSVKSFDSDGFTLGTATQVNPNGVNMVSWNWLAANGTASNSNGSITSTVSANTTAGFSIVSYTANGTQGATVGHGLSSAPEMVITKDRSVGTSSYNWGVYHIGLDSTSPEDKYIELNNTSGVSDFTYWNDTKPSNTVVTLGDAVANNTNNSNIIMYCFHSVKGYSKFGSYTGNGNADGSFIYTGFKPAFIIIKNSEESDAWHLYDNKRLGYNVDNNALYPNASNAEQTNDDLDILSNGFKIRRNIGTLNNSSRTYIYMAFGQSLVGTNNIPCTAR